MKKERMYEETTWEKKEQEPDNLEHKIYRKYINDAITEMLNCANNEEGDEDEQD